ncbi:hypothetical protein FOA52_004325 [Chlamydomonas sp. UWO 241]|nr:hypothetical protein FOA52_004325 [Chlamydomonas sp. UWO 241]
MSRRLLTYALYAGGAGGAVLTATTLAGWGAKPEPEQFLSEVVPTRQQQLSRIKAGSKEKPFDLLIIGGGATGAGCAADAATRGIKTVLIEREDFGSGTSSKSTKLVHGGVRYLEKAVFQADPSQLKLVFEALHERTAFLHNAPHLAHPLGILTPCYQWWEVPYYWAGLKAYDAIAGTGNLVMSKFINRTESLTMLPTLAKKGPNNAGLKGGILYFDGQFDDARMCVALATTAAASGGMVANHMECSRLLKNPEGLVVGAVVRDTLSNETFEVHAKVVLNATGPFLDGVRKMSDAGAATRVTGAVGTHITLPAFYGSGQVGVLVPKTKDGRVLFLLPWMGALIAGTTDIKCDAIAKPAATEAEVTWILDSLSETLGVRVRRDDVLSAWAGIRPLPAAPKTEGNTQNVVRDHLIFTDADGMVNVTGGKWTTYRNMAEEAVNAAIATGRLPQNATKCRTHKMKLLGAERYSSTSPAELCQQLLSEPLPGCGSAADVANHLASSYGDRAGEVVKIAREQGAGVRLVPGHPILEAEVLYCAQSEYCETVDDFLERRTRLAFLDAKAALAAVPRVAELMGTQLGWSTQRKAQEVEKAKAVITVQYFPA